MRTVTIPLYNNQKIELFVEKIKDGFELWEVGIVKGQRVVIDHSLTRDDLETRLEYARPEDLIWCDATGLEIPAEKHKMAIEREESFKQGRFQHGITRILSAMDFIDKDKKDTAAAKKTILGRWTDGMLTFSIEPNNKLQWLCATHEHWLNRRKGTPPDWWNLSNLWELHLMCNINTPEARGTHVGVLRIDENELHLRDGVNRIAHVFRRVKDNESVQIGTA